jgi:acetyl esterase/lipase
MSRWSAEDFHPGLRGLARFLPIGSVNRVTYKLARGIFTLVARKQPADIEIVQVTPTATVRVHRPLDPGAPNVDARRAGLLWIHGGGMIMGDALQDDDFCRRVANLLNVTVAAVNYRVAPEHQYPAALDDCFDALQWLGAQPNVDPAKIAIGGGSAGGGLAAALALRVREEGGTQPVLQVLVYPMLDDRTAARPDPLRRSRRLWSNKANAFGWTSYLGRPAGSADISPLAAPARATDLSGLPPAWIGVGTLDLFHDEDVAYAGRLQEAGVATDLVVVPGAYHGFDAIAAKAEVSKTFRDAQVDALAAAFSAADGEVGDPSSGLSQRTPE